MKRFFPTEIENAHGTHILWRLLTRSRAQIILVMLSGTYSRRVPKYWIRSRTLRRSIGWVTWQGFRGLQMLMHRCRLALLLTSLGLSREWESSPQWGEVFPDSLQAPGPAAIRGQELIDSFQAQINPDGIYRDASGDSYVMRSISPAGFAGRPRASRKPES